MAFEFGAVKACVAVDSSNCAAVVVVVVTNGAVVVVLALVVVAVFVVVVVEVSSTFGVVVFSVVNITCATNKQLYYKSLFQSYLYTVVK